MNKEFLDKFIEATKDPEKQTANAAAAALLEAYNDKPMMMAYVLINNGVEAFVKAGLTNDEIILLLDTLIASIEKKPITNNVSEPVQNKSNLN